MEFPSYNGNNGDGGRRARDGIFGRNLLFSSTRHRGFAQPLSAKRGELFRECGSYSHYVRLLRVTADYNPLRRVLGRYNMRYTLLFMYE